MHCCCVRHTDLPHTSALFADVLYHPDRVTSFYRHPFRDLEDFRQSAAAIRFSAAQRSALVAALAQRNPRGRSLEMLAQPETVAVVTGQQVGLFLGPSYTLYKALHAVRLAQWLTAQGVPAVPVFWLATEDHDFAEVNHAWIFDALHTPTKLEMRRTTKTQPVGDVALSNPPLREFRAVLQSLPFGDETADLVEETYRAGNTMGGAFGELLRRLLERFDVLQVDPMLPAFRELAAPPLRAAVERSPELTARVIERNKALAAAGYHAQVHVEDHTAFFFLLENGKRLGLRRAGEEYILNGRRFSLAELADLAPSLSPNALLRPVVQDSMLPTVAYIGGPAEVAYLAQSAVLYDSILGRMPLAIPRTGFTILDARTEKLMARYGLGLADFFHGPDVLREHVAARLAPPALNNAMNDASGAVDAALDRLRRDLAGFDPTLAAALDRSSRKIHHQLDKIGRKAGREALRRNARAAADAASLYGLLFPERHLQERLYSILPFLAKHGLDLVDHVYEAIQLDCVDHRLMVL